MNHISTTAANDTTAITLAEPNTWLNFLAHAARDPSIEVGKLEALRRMQREDIAEDARLQYIRAMASAQAEMLPVTRDAHNDQTRSKYARLETIDAAIRPIYTRHGFTLEFNSEAIEGPNERIVCEVSHAGGHAKKFQLEAPPDVAGAKGNANKTPLHGLASTVSYIRRYLVCMVFNVVLANDDNDGNRGRPAANDTGELAGRTQAEELYRLLAECSLNGTVDETSERAFLKAMGMGELRTIKEVPVGHFIRCKNALLTKQNIMRQRAARANTQAGQSS
jgi:hypothetical protein